MKNKIIIVRFLSTKDSYLVRKHKILEKIRGYLPLTSPECHIFKYRYLLGCHYFKEDPPVIEIYWDDLVDFIKSHYSKQEYIWIGVLVKLLETFIHEFIHCLDYHFPNQIKFQGKVKIGYEGLPLYIES